MSDASITIPLARAQQAAARLRELLPLPESSCPVVGSVRRGRLEVHDIEIIAPLAQENTLDRLWLAIRDNEAEEGGGLFAAAGPAKPVLRVVKGLAPLFRHVRLQVALRGTDDWLPIEIYRYDTTTEKANRGWIELMRTGPTEFGQWFLTQWHKRWELRPDKPASVEGYLRDEHGAVVPVATEQEAFAKAGIPFIEPARREAVALGVWRNK